MFGFQEVKTLEQINLTLLDYLIQHLHNIQNLQRDFIANASHELKLLFQL